jgi:hypothetical protein
MPIRPDDTPRVRASHCRATLRTLRALVPGAVAPVQARLPEEVRLALASATAVDLVPAAWDVALVQAIAGELGGPATRELARATMLDSLRGPLLGHFAEGAIRLFGASPGRLFGWAGRVWGHVTTGCGALRLEASGEATAVLLLEGMPTALAVPAYLEAVAGTLESIFILCEVAGEVAATHRPDGARFDARWRATGRPRAAP